MGIAKEEEKEEEKQNDSSQETELETCRRQSEEYLNNWKRERADFANYKKEEMKRFEELAKFANQDLILEIIGALDDLEIAVQHLTGKEGPADKEGLAAIIKKFQNLLVKHGVERIKTEGKFNPNLHEVVGAGGSDEVEEIRGGYIMNGRVIRPARVKIK